MIKNVNPGVLFVYSDYSHDFTYILISTAQIKYLMRQLNLSNFYQTRILEIPAFSVATICNTCC